jgi:alkanesulfonate monooxygenase SsuD/methylene tetrahydromethanopterin reductase-like flavin-dependent oxidoreductase (luciferase family)
MWVGGNATAAMRRAARFADGWDAPYADVDALRAGIARLHAACESVGRDPSTLHVSVRGLVADAVDAPLVAAYAALGVTDIGVMLPGLSVDGLRALARRVPNE